MDFNYITVIKSKHKNEAACGHLNPLDCSHLYCCSRVWWSTTHVKNRHLKFENEDFDKVDKDDFLCKYKKKLNFIYKCQNELKRKYKEKLNFIYKYYNRLKRKHHENLNLFCQSKSTTRLGNCYFKPEKGDKIDILYDLICKYQEKAERKYKEIADLTCEYQAELAFKVYEECDLLNLIRKYQEKHDCKIRRVFNRHPKLENEKGDKIDKDFLNVEGKYPEDEYLDLEREHYLQHLKNRHLKPENEDGDK